MDQDKSEGEGPPAGPPATTFQARITGAALLTAVAVLLAACAVFTWEQWRADRADLSRLQAAVTRVIADNAAASLITSNKVAAEAVLTQLSAAPHFREARMLDPWGRTVAEYKAPPRPGGGGKTPTVEVRQTIRVDGVAVGQLVAISAPDSLRTILPRYLALTFALFFAATGIALFTGRWLAARITRPVERLSEAMHAVAFSGDFAQRVEPLADDEFGRLTNTFNGLLGQLHINDQALRHTMEELVEARDAADTANQLKSQFLANMSHEIRTPLNGVLAMAQILAMDDLRPEQRERIQVIRQSGESLLSILNDVLDVSKIEAGKLELEEVEFDAAEVLRAAYAAFRPMAEKKGLALELVVGDEAQGIRRGDAARLRQIINNLLSNAVKFTAKGSVSVIMEGAGGGEGLRIAVRDTGIGIPADKAPLLFQKFTQADNTTTRKFGGTGLGLSICQELTALMGGRVWLESEEGVGSVFHLTLPMPRVGEAKPLPSVEEAHQEEGEDRAIRVLAAEDNQTNQLVLRTIMDIFGVELVIVDDGRQAVDAWEKGEFDVVLMDIQMPEMDGVSATRAIRAAEAATGRRRTPIVALSANAMTHQVAEYLGAGMDMHVAKPIELPKLQAALEAVMNGESAHAATEAA